MRNYAAIARGKANTTTFCRTCFTTFPLGWVGMVTHMREHASSEPLTQYTLTNRTIDTHTDTKNGLGK